jgi:hypothetical protein
MYIIKSNNIITFYDQLPNDIPNVTRWHEIFPRKGYLIAKIYMSTNREPTNLGMTIMEKMQNMKSPTKTPSPKLKLSPNTPPPKKPRRY